MNDVNTKQKNFNFFSSHALLNDLKQYYENDENILKILRYTQVFFLKFVWVPCKDGGSIEIPGVECP